MLPSPARRALDRYLESLELERGLSRHTVAGYGADLRRLEQALRGTDHDLLTAGRPELALHALDAAWELCPTEEPRRAAFTCALEVHCDLGNYEIAETIEREQYERSVDDRFARAALRLYSALSRITDLDIHYARRAHYIALLNGRELSAAD